MPDPKTAKDNIEEHRASIDALDEKIVALLNERAEHALAIRELKPAVNMGLYDPKREEEIFARISGLNAGPLFAENLREIYTAILRVMKEIPA